MTTAFARAAFATLAVALATLPARADESRLIRAAEALVTGLPYPQARALLRRAGWQPYVYRGGRRCAGEPSPCRIYPEFRACWSEGAVYCSFEFVATKRRPPRLDDMVLNVKTTLGPDGRLLYVGQDITSHGGHG